MPPRRKRKVENAGTSVWKAFQRQDPLGRSTTTPGFGRGPVASPIVDVDTRRAQLNAGYGTPGKPALDPINTDPVSVAREQKKPDNFGMLPFTPEYIEEQRTGVKQDTGVTDTTGSGSSQSDAPVATEEELALERMRRLWSNRLSNATQNAQSMQARLEAQNQAAYEQGLRKSFADTRDYRQSLTGTGRGFSPRFTDAVSNAYRMRAVAEQAARDDAARSALFDIIGALRSERAEASEFLSDQELDALTSISGTNLANFGSGAINAMFRRR